MVALRVTKKKKRDLLLLDDGELVELSDIKTLKRRVEWYQKSTLGLRVIKKEKKERPAPAR